MAIRNELLRTDRAVGNIKPIEFQTQNGFSIVRLSEIDDSVPDVGFVHRFIVRDPDGFELEITVEIAENLTHEVIRRSRGRLSQDSSYWIYCAERHLAEYLWENEDYPPDGKLMVDQPTPDDIDLAWRWETQSVGKTSVAF